MFGFQYRGFWFLVFSAAHSGGIGGSLVLDTAARESAHRGTAPAASSRFSYRHPGVGQDLLRGEPGFHVHLQHLADQHLKRVTRHY